MVSASFWVYNAAASSSADHCSPSIVTWEIPWRPLNLFSHPVVAPKFSSSPWICLCIFNACTWITGPEMGMPSERVWVNHVKTAFYSCWSWAVLPLFLACPQSSMVLQASLSLFSSFSHPRRLGDAQFFTTFACVFPCRIWSTIWSFSMIEYAILFLEVWMIAILEQHLFHHLTRTHKFTITTLQNTFFRSLT